MKTKKVMKSIVSLTLAIVMVATFAFSAAAAYHEWEFKGTTTVIGYDGALWWKEIIGKQELSSYHYENYDDQFGAKAVCDHYTYNSSTEKYTSGWKNSTECYATARIETKLGIVVLDSGRVFDKYKSTAQTPDLAVGVPHTYCGNTAAN